MKSTPPIAPQDIDPASILLVDDNPRNLDALESILQSPVHSLVRASSGDEALLALMKTEFAVIVLDIQMPNMSGLELAKLIKMRRRSQHIPILFLTAHFQDDKDVLEGYGVGAVDYLTKPINPLILKSKIGVFVDLFRANRALALANAALESEILQRKEAEAALQQLNDQLEARVQQRTEELSRANAALIRSEEQFRRTAEEAPVPVIMQAEDGTVLQISKAWARLTGYDLEDVPTFDAWLTRAYGFGANEVRNAVRGLFAGDRGMVEVEFEIRTRSDERRIWAFYASSPGTLSDGRRFVVGTAMDITDRKRAEESLRASRNSERAHRQELEAVMQAAPAAILIARDSRCLEITGNPTAYAMLRMTPGENMSKSAPNTAEAPKHFEVFHNGAKLSIDELPMQVAARTGQAVDNVELEWRFQDGTATWVYGSTTPLFDERGQVSGAVSTFVDITQLKLAEAALREAKAETEAASRAKDDFLAALSHELRTPLNPAILLASEWERETTLPAEVREVFGAIRKDIELEAHLIDDLLDLTRIAHGKLRLVPKPTEVHALVQASWDLLKAEVEEKPLTLRFDLAPEPAWVEADPVRLQQVFWNVIKNAVRFSPQRGEIVIRSGSDRPGWIRVQIADQGIGIEPVDRERIFLPFDQGNKGHRVGGLGLGLAISRRLVELHGGTIAAESEGSGRGATFSIELPLSVAPAEAPAPALPPKHLGGAIPTRRILIVEDHLQTRQALAGLLAKRGHEVVAARTIHEAQDFAACFPFELVLSDLELPDGSGHELMVELRRLRPDCRGIALSGYGMESDIQRSREAGFDIHLTKPVDVDALDAALRLVSSELPAQN